MFGARCSLAKESSMAVNWRADEHRGGDLISKVPQVTVMFWVIKIFATTVGEACLRVLPSGEDGVRSPHCPTQSHRDLLDRRRFNPFMGMMVGSGLFQRILKHQMSTAPSSADAGDNAIITCTSCKACCCRLEVMLMSEDTVPLHLTEEDRWGGRVMARLDDGWCAALERDTMLCGIYENRPTICRDYELGGGDCSAERSNLIALSNEGIAPR
jgi:hypothetical protein